MTSQKLRVFVHSFSTALPPRCVTNFDLAKLMDTSDEWIVQRTGIKTRYWAEPPITTSELGVDSSRRTFALAPDCVPQALVAATTTPDYCFPGIGVLIQTKLGLPSIPAYDIRDQCSGFLYGLEMAAALLMSGMYEHVLLVGAEVQSTGLDVSTRGRDMAVLFGDGAGSCLVSTKKASAPTQNFEFLGSELHSDGQYVKELWCEHPGSSHFPTRLTEEIIRNGGHFPAMNGRKVFENAVRRMTEVSKSLLERHKVSAQALRLVVAHQANIRINQMLTAELGVREDQVFNTIERFGNTTAASIPIGMTEALKAIKFNSGDYVLNAAFGSGFTWGATLLRCV